VDHERLIRMRDRLAHRGPDGNGAWVSADRQIGLAHRRLAIVDLSPTGHQPMISADGRFTLVYNGEIYNFRSLRDQLTGRGHRFIGTSDTEVLLAAWTEWGSAAIDRLSGMFAFVLWDARERRLYGVRDRAGEKPFFYYHRDGLLVFGSELKALLEHPELPRIVNPQAMDEFLAYGYVSRERCLLDGFRKLPAGSFFSFDIDRHNLTVSPYWELPHFRGGRPRSLDELAEEFEPLLEASVQRQLVADVPVGVLLSGGLDSSLIAATAMKVAGGVKTFTIGFPGHARLDESPIARRLAGDLGTEHVELMAEPETRELLPMLARQFDEPIADSSMIPTFLVSRLIRRDATVALGGDGGDELFGGYPQHNWARRIVRYRRAGLHRLGLAGLAARVLPNTFFARKMALRLLDRADPVVTVSRLADPLMRRRLMGDRLDFKGPRAEDWRAELLDRWADVGERAMAHDFLTYMCDDILVKVDRASMLTSLEVRAPLLDRDIIEFAFGRLAPLQRADGSGRKLLLRHIARRKLPSWFDVERKQGFSIPLGAWLRGSWAALLEDLANDSADGLLDPQAVRSFLRAGRGSDRLAHQIYQLAMLDLWRREYAVTVA
jgi:asparagine synthase (glutamine-hydrolysing)